MHHITLAPKVRTLVPSSLKASRDNVTKTRHRNDSHEVVIVNKD